MGEEVDVKVIKRTQETLGKIIKKPPLTEKLLRKPPFRFLHDIVTNVINTTGFMKDVFTSDELISDNIKDKESKIKFLQKVIDEVGSAVGDRLSVRPGKVVAGHEADKTNLFLQALAQATQNGESGNEKKSVAETAKVKEKKTSRDRAPSKDRRKDDVKNDADKNKSKVRSRSQDKPAVKKEKSSKEVKKASSSTDEPNKSKSRLSTKEKPRETHRSRKTEGEKEKPGKKKEKSPTKAADRSDKTSVSPTKQNASKIENQEPEEDNIIQSNSDEVNGLVEMGANGLHTDDGGEGDATISRPPIARPATSLRSVTSRPLTTRPTTSTIRKISSNDNEHENNEDTASLLMSPTRQVVVEDGAIRPPTSFNRLRSARPASARPPPPVLKSKRVVSEEPPPNMEDQNGVTNLIVENDKDNEEDDAFVTEEPTTELDIELEPLKQATDINVEGSHGSLVTQILESKKDLESGSELDHNKVEIDKSMLADVTRRKERDVVVREVEKMRSNIQVLTRSINPLGKMIDYLQEDVDSMQKELITWQRENQKHSQQLKRERSGLEQSLEPLKVQLDDLDHAIQDQMDKIGNVKSNILRNEEKIQKLLAYHKS